MASHRRKTAKKLKPREARLGKKPKEMDPEARATLCALLKNFEAPPLKAGDLIVIALLDSEKDQLLKGEVIDWAIAKFAYCQLEAGKSYAKITHGGAKSTGGKDSFSSLLIPGLDDAFSQRPQNLLPLMADVQYYWTYGRNPYKIYDYEKVALKIDEQAAREFTQRLFAPVRTDFFPFLEVPPELRNQIYGLLLDFSGEGELCFKFNPDVSAAQPARHAL